MRVQVELFEEGFGEDLVGHGVFARSVGTTPGVCQEGR
jgi:hypothetical protein